jgi:uncharacterized protein
MTQKSFRDPSLHQFSGLAPLFPLPGCVLLPHALLPLYIFEPRYRAMSAAALDGERLIAMSLVRFESQTLSTADIPPIAPMVGLGRIIAHERLDDGRYMLVLRGIARARVLHEKAVALPYRIGQLQICEDVVPDVEEFDRQTRAEEIVALFCRLFPGEKLQRVVHQAMTDDVPLGTICDVIAAELPIGADLMQLFLEEPNADVRSRMLWQLLKRMEGSTRREDAPTTRRFPPHFSLN